MGGDVTVGREALLPAALWSRQNYDSAREIAASLEWDRSGLHEGDQDGGPDSDDSQVLVRGEGGQGEEGQEGGERGLQPEDEVRLKEREVAAAQVCWDEARELVCKCSCVVGMHPDQASEAIVQVTCVRVCVYMYVCAYVYMYVCICVCMYMYACMPVCMYACMHVCMFVCMHACMHACMHTNMHACMYAYKHACMHV